MRKSREEAAETRKRIVQTAATTLRERGVDGAGIADIMAAAGLTTGGFYRHFASKDQLVAEACDVAGKTLHETLQASVLGKSARDGRSALVRRYLSTMHRDAPGKGCPLAAIGSDMARADARTREVAEEAYLRIANTYAQLLGGSDASKRSKSLAATSAMIGALLISRIVEDEALSQEILDATQDMLDR